MSHTALTFDTVVTVAPDCPIRVEQDKDTVDLHFNESRLGQLFCLQFTRPALDALIARCQAELATH
ncbi:hypothetical protein V5P93_000939 [Actinokineospora auranticolor]|uniref:Uncharacterized protein n=1 Tax=Actinokineospora auranticolor TaxID=155976 RepID=A0A2S6GY81_9PSEU|nr:hypothetical protein [Actinokineospora auranticolor]PPK70183.1 hypothetical protein CLV40_10293 [Actinokineospora auranticolor]